MEPLKCQIFVTDFRQTLPVTVSVAVLLVLVAFSLGCRGETPPASIELETQVQAESEPGVGVTGETNSLPSVDALLCADCELVEVIEVVDANTVRTAIGDIQMYGAYVIDQPPDCAELARERLASLAGGAILIEPGPAETVRNDSDHYYLFTADGRSIEEHLVREGLALVWTQDGQHVGWFLFRGASARENEAGCLWKGYKAFQRGEPSDFRVPGLTYPEDR